MVYTLQVSGFDAQGFENDAVFWVAMKEQRSELIILDVMLPGEELKEYELLKLFMESPGRASLMKSGRG